MNDLELEEKLRGLSKSLGHFPSNSELREMRLLNVANAITRSGGFIAWAERIGVARLNSDSDFGWAGEAKAAQMLKEHGYAAEKAGGVKAPYDLLVAGILRVDVKTANYAEYGACRGWFYRIGKVPQADLVFLLQMDTGDFYPLPWFVCPTSNITISRGGGKYASYRNNWETIRAMVAMRTMEQAITTGPVQDVA